MSKTRIKKVLIPAAGLGTRLFPVTKEFPKEMLRIAIRKGQIILMKPMLQAIFEQFYVKGVREFCIDTGRGKRGIEDHFTADWPLLRGLEPSVGEVRPGVFLPTTRDDKNLLRQSGEEAGVRRCNTAFKGIRRRGFVHCPCGRRHR